MERPRIRCLVALMAEGKDTVVRATAICDLLDLPEVQQFGWRLIGVDPADEAEFMRWRDFNPFAA